MRPDVADLFRAISHHAELRRVVHDADLHTAPPAPEPDVVEPYRWFLSGIGDGVTLRDLHGLLHAAMGWRDAHLWMVELDGVQYGDLEDMEELGDPGAVRIGSLPDGTVFRYDYDLGDGWEHDVRVGTDRVAEAPTCLDGARGCPPEGCGGPPGCARLREVLADPGHPEHPDLTDWLGAPFDPEPLGALQTTQRMRERRRAR